MAIWNKNKTLEDTGLVRAIDDGLNTEVVEREEVFKLLEGGTIQGELQKGPPRN